MLNKFNRTLIYLCMLLAAALIVLMAVVRPGVSGREAAPPPYARRLAAAIPMPDAIKVDIGDEKQEKRPPEDALSATDILANTNLIAHGMGAVDGLNTLNCLEGFLTQYKAGVRVFEADLRLSRDCKVVLRDDWWPSDCQSDIN